MESSKLINWVYNGIEDNLDNREWFAQRLILCEFNFETNEINETVLARLPGEEIEFLY